LIAGSAVAGTLVLNIAEMAKEPAKALIGNLSQQAVDLVGAQFAGDKPGADETLRRLVAKATQEAIRELWLAYQNGFTITI
jgi:hypothetical protein